MTLPIDRTNLTAAQTNQVPNALLRSALNIAALTTPYDTIDELNTKVDANHAAGAVGTTQLADLSVTSAKLAASAVTTAKIADSNVTLAKMADASVGTAELVDLSVTTAKIAIGAVGVAQLSPVAAVNETVNNALIVALSADVVQRAFNVKSAPYGAKGDGVTNDTLAFQAVSAAIIAAGGGKLTIPKGTYICGIQNFAGATGQGYSYRLQDILNISNCDKVEIECAGAIFKMAAGLKFGSFDPVTGAVYSPVLPFVNADYQAGLGYMIKVTDCNSLLIHGDLELNGNMANITLGGLWGDAGRQCAAYGLYLNNVPNCMIGNLNAHHHCLDGVRIGVTSNLATDAMTTQYMSTIRSQYNARQGFTIEGTTGLTLVNCKGNHTGKATFSSSPAAGIDFEPPTGCVVRNVTVINCEFANNVGLGMVADSGDSADVAFYTTKFFGTTSNSIWPKMPRFKFYDCLISGEAVSCYTATTEKNRTLFSDCLFTPDITFEGNAVYGTRLANLGTQNPIFENTAFSTLNSAVSLPFTGANATFKNCTLVQNGSVAEANTNGIFLGENKIDMTTGSMNAPSLTNYGRVVTTGTITSPVKAPNGEIRASSPTYSTLNTMGSNGSTYQGNTVTWGYQAPTSGTWVRGDKVYNIAGTGAGFIDHWRCITSGTPGTWVPVQGGSALTTVSFTPDAIGFLALVSGIPYISVGTSSSANWKNIGRYVAAPATATSTGAVGEFSSDGTYLYICHAANTWRRVAIAAW